ncbi:hypothetical protein SAMN05444159_1985 [Bradyrhizobium lablabi]|uniref:Uncharacterized protein n=1 Tax=Bradyrhizobium lablabi TaxID=722472 RepID=A0A1M6NFZ7_9BRAD|nr:hypothetical protein [Bradyrhizobium lablabi]SHJ94655.1 hypothetical protein SAMN05444159_1985 [Bradyrhizobium lablabi]
MGVLAKRGGIVAVLSFMSAMVFGSAFAQDSSKMNKLPTPVPGHFNKACPPGHRVEFVVGSLSLFVDPRWLDIASLAPLSERFGSNCPSQPVTISSIYFSKLTLDAANIPATLGQPFLFFVIRNEAELPLGRMTKLDLPNAPPLRQTAEPYIEEITRSAFRADPHPSPSARVYRLVYPGIGNESPTSIEISCGGDPGHLRGRNCFTPIAYSYLGGLSVQYEFRQDHLPIIEPGQVASPGAMYEPDGVLVFDRHIRAWLDSLTKNP